MFNKSKIKLLESVNKEQLIKLSEMEAKLHYLNTKVAYLEADNEAKKERIVDLKEQLKSEIEQKLEFQQSFKQLYTPSTQKLKEELNSAYVEDEKEIEEIVKDFINDPGDL